MSCQATPSSEARCQGGGSENKANFVTLRPADSIADWVVQTVPTLGAGWCPPGVLGIGVGGSAEKAMLLAKEPLLAPIDMHALKARGPRSRIEELRIEMYDRVNALGIGAQGLGGLTTVLDVKILDYPTHAASLPVAMIPNCAATRHVRFVLDGAGPAHLPVPTLADWPRSRGRRLPRRDGSTSTPSRATTWRTGHRARACCSAARC